MKEFKGLLKSEIKKAETAANKFFGTTNAKVTAYFVGERHEYIVRGDWCEVKCEICFDYENRADYDVVINVFMPDRRRSFAKVKTW